MNVIELNRREEITVEIIKLTDFLAQLAQQDPTPSTREKMNTLARKVVDLTAPPQQNRKTR
ncbi:hypothetical protein [Pseudotabrizicola alkalilacus]|uniref:Uncharacterized protein n=1 Tax=Pseudotabrizicola alkalilacus TaxID=2305252 RepID=A0A411Z1J1_9RHOB|nr:hypothetical protein [Pseudotabrizicola alkalilacus]RGP36931.1 hypothetical protein D1012_12330 [Pseudotabrizicola alkalilacus]